LNYKFTLKNQRVYYEDTDAIGIAYHASYLKFMDRARCECLWDMGICFNELAKSACCFVVSDINIKYLKPMHLQDMVNISCDVVEVGNTFAVFKQQVVHNEKPEHIHSLAEVKIVSIDDRGKPMLLPEAFRSRVVD
jgi:tol-pal system-associated acyl-CoA thioesterase